MNLKNDSYLIRIGIGNATEHYFRDRGGWVKVSTRGRAFRATAEQVLNHVLPALAGLKANVTIRVEHYEDGPPDLPKTGSASSGHPPVACSSRTPNAEQAQRTLDRSPRMTQFWTLRLTGLLLGASVIGTVIVSAAQGVAPRTAWDGVYSEAQAARGRAAYEEQCAFCHQSDLQGQGFAPALVVDTFTDRWKDGNLGDLFTIVKVTMPQDKPASLTDEAYAAIVAYLLRANRYPAGQQDLPPDPAALKEVVFERLGTSRP
jgi:quinoprotein glucose dehydrogenase